MPERARPTLLSALSALPDRSVNLGSLPKADYAGRVVMVTTLLVAAVYVEVVAESLLLAIDPYPRLEGERFGEVELPPVAGEGAAASPFARLKGK